MDPNACLALFLDSSTAAERRELVAAYDAWKRQHGSWAEADVSRDGRVQLVQRCRVFRLAVNGSVLLHAYADIAQIVCEPRPTWYYWWRPTQTAIRLQVALPIEGSAAR
jgi:hypothetical protein